MYNRYLNEHKVSSYYDRPNTVHPLDSLYGSWIHFDTSIGWQIHTSQGKTDTTIIHTPSLIAGLLGLAFGPNGLGWIPLSNDLGTYAAILIALVFGALPLSSPNVSMKEVAKRVGPMWAYAQVGMLLQWALVGLFGLYVIKLIWPDLNDAFGIMLPTRLLWRTRHGRCYRVCVRGIGLGRGSQFRHDNRYRGGYLLDHRRFTDGQMGGQA